MLTEAIHRYLDRSPRPTYAYERAAALLVEVVLLAACALPAVTGLRSAVAVSLVSALRLYEVELRREDASVCGRHREGGGVSPLPPVKVARAARRERALEVVAWLWPGLTMLIMAAEVGRVAVPTLMAIAATLNRAAWSRLIMPAWRRSRLAWRSKKAVSADWAN